VEVFTRGDGSAWERLHGIYTYGTKHSLEKYDVAVHKEMPTTIWLTNEGIECMDGSRITFIELTEIIAANNRIFYDVRKAALDAISNSKQR
jgi:hypothetical protein